MRRPATIVAIAAIAAGAALFYAGGVSSQLSTWGFDGAGSEQLRALEKHRDASGVDPTGAVIAMIKTEGPVDSREGRRLARTSQRLIAAEPGIERIDVPFGGDATPGLISNDGHTAVVVGFLKPSEINGEAPNDLMRSFVALRDDGVTLGGEAVRRKVVSNTVQEDLKHAEMFALPLLFVVALFVFRGFIAALLPMLVSAITIPFALSLMRMADHFSDMSVYSLSLVTGLGLGLAIDYSLLMVTRFREELVANDDDRYRAVRATVETAGRTVFFSAITVAGAAASLMIFPQSYLYSMGFGGMTVALMSAFTALFILPSALVLLGPRVNKFPIRRKAPVDTGRRWELIARGAMRHPGTVTFGVFALVVVMMMPAIDTRFATIDNRSLPAEYGVRVVGETLEREFDRSPLATQLFALVDAPSDGDGELARFVKRADAAGAIRGDLGDPIYLGDDVWRVDAYTGEDAFSARAETTVKAFRAAASDAPVLTAGQSSWYVDQKESIRQHIPQLLLIIGLVTFVALFMMTGSVVLPIKTFVLNLATIAAVFGVVVWIFQNRHLEGVLDYTGTGAMDITMPVSFFAITFGLTTDYGVFLLSRIKELHDAGHTNEDAVALGVRRTARVITSAALLLCIAVFAFTFSRVMMVKSTGIAIGLAIAFDATIIRALLVPSLMKLLGEYNWWAPGPLRRLHDRWGWSDAPAATPEVPTTAPGKPATQSAG